MMAFSALIGRQIGKGKQKDHNAPQPNETETSSVVAEIVQGLCSIDEVLMEDCSKGATDVHKNRAAIRGLGLIKYHKGK